MAKKQVLFEMPPVMEGVDFEKMLHGIANKEDFETLADMNPYIRLVNKPKEKVLKSKDGPDLNSGDMGDPVSLHTDCGWLFSYHLAKPRKPAFVEISAGLLQEEVNVDPEVSDLTMQAKTFRTAVEVVDFLRTQGWKKLAIEEGSPAMCWAFWAYLTHQGLAVSGFEPSSYDQLRYDNARELFSPVQESVAKLTSAPTPSGPGGVVSSETAPNLDSEE